MDIKRRCEEYEGLRQDPKALSYGMLWALMDDMKRWGILLGRVGVRRCRVGGYAVSSV